MKTTNINIFKTKPNETKRLVKVAFHNTDRSANTKSIYALSEHYYSNIYLSRHLQTTRFDEKPNANK